ncbi:Imm51 family immunity protein [Piscinibacter terrae]|uniref:Immunity protein 51 n=1 Tax=Piscinibacter terrae TaxID=2496871 RepID=A0A3N7HZA7_9BURK|nr:Imm51 family immunity protein [Albitalea terrae]RQP26451.1 hypothetical protein DZC73_05445 [Albitalea terrae]
MTRRIRGRRSDRSQGGLKPMSIEFEYDWSEHDDGTISLVFSPPDLQAFKDAGLEGSGHDWEDLLEAVLPRLAPDTLVGTTFDCEADLFAAVNRNPFALQEMASVVESLVEDEAALRSLLRHAGLVR